MRWTGGVWLTIHDVATEMGLELSDEQAWEIGRQLADRYEAIEKVRPEKVLRPKKRGQGSHCFAVYPPSWVPRLMAAIKHIEAARAAQGELPL